jgi:hypothetical protein
MAFFSKTNVMVNFLQNLALFRVKNAIFCRFFGENILKIITSVPDEFVKALLKVYIAKPSSCYKIMQNFFHGKSSPIGGATSVNKKMPKVDNHPIGENLPNLVTL